jgi:hypothetical protein
VMFEVDGYPIEEIAAMQGVSLSAVKSRLARGRERLRRHYERMGYVAAPGPGRGPAVRLNAAPAEAGKEQPNVG